MSERVSSLEARRIADQVAGPFADQVDREARFPLETVTELRWSGLLGALVPVEWGGPGTSVEEASRAVTALAEHCASSALVLDIVLRAMTICGLPSYKNDSPFSLARILRDAAAAPLTVNNDRALEATAQALLVRKVL